MAKHRRRYHDVVGVTLNGLGLSGSVGTKDVALGVGAGVAGAAALKAAFNNFSAFANVVPAVLRPYLAEIGAALAGAGLYFGQKRSAKAKGHLIGALGFATGSLVWKLLQSSMPAMFAGVVSVRLNGVDYGLMVDDGTVPAVQSMDGLITDDSSGQLGDSQANLAELAAASMGDDTDDPFVDALEMLG
jgi:hypothetical protein